MEVVLDSPGKETEEVVALRLTISSRAVRASSVEAGNRLA